ncbi:MAG: hypothetical protein Q8P20_08220 [bacterium]|nr:hypothetical protein [bacterium]
MKIFIKIFLIILVLALFSYKYFIYYDNETGCFIKLKTAIFEPNTVNVKNAIKTLKYAVPDEYEKLCLNVDTIDPNLSCGGFQGGCYNSHNGNRLIQIGTANDDFLGWTAAIIAHETCHAIQFQTNGIEGLEESECYAIGDQVMKTLIDYEYE